VVASNNDYLSMDVGLQRGVDAISMNECLPIVSPATRAKDKRVFGVRRRTESADRGDSYGAFVTFRKQADSRVYINSVVRVRYGYQTNSESLNPEIS
jgi:hypothetical protein